MLRQLKVHAILNEIDGKTHNGSRSAPPPTLFGMNFQAVSVGEKLIEKGVGTGGYQDSIGTPSSELKSEIQFADDSIGEMVSELKKKRIRRSTTTSRESAKSSPVRKFPSFTIRPARRPMTRARRTLS